MNQPYSFRLLARICAMIQRSSIAACTIALCLIWSTDAHAQLFSTKGTSFWVSFMANFPTPRLQLFLSADVLTNATVNIPGSPPTTVTIPAGGITPVTVPVGVSTYNTASDAIGLTGIFITANNPISVYAFNTVQASTDATLVLPVESLGNDYITFNSDFRETLGSEFMVVGVADNTQIQITPTANIVNAVGGVVRPANVPYTITLNRGQVYLAISNNSINNGDLSGTRIQGVGGNCSPFAVFSGHVRTALGSAAVSRDHLFEQMFPTQSWGRNFLVSPLAYSRSTDIRIAALRNGTQVTVNGVGTFTLNSGRTLLLPRVTAVTSITASAPIAVVQYMLSNNGNSTQTTGDPFMTWISPVEQTLNRITFNSFDPGTSPEWFTNMYANLLVPTASAASCTIDGISVPTITRTRVPGVIPAIIDQFTGVLSGTGYTMFVLRVGTGSHTIVSPGGVIANIYAMATVDSYGFLAGAALRDLNMTIVAAGLKADTTACPRQPVNLRGTAIDSDQVVSWRWLLPNGASADGQSITTTFADTGTFTVRLLIQRSSGCRFDTVETSVRVRNPLRVTASDTSVCQGTTAVGVRATTQGTSAKATFSWTAVDPGVAVVSGGGTPSATFSLPDVPGTYRVRVTAEDAERCVSPPDTAVITVFPAPKLVFTGSTAACAGQALQLTAEVSNRTPKPYKFSWSPSKQIIGFGGEATVNVVTSDVGRRFLKVNVIDGRGCEGSDSVLVTVRENPVVAAGADVKIICIGDSTDIGTGGKVTGGTPPYKSQGWRRLTPGAPNIIAPSQLETRIHPTLSGTYVYEVVDDNGCVGTDTVFCDVRQIPDANAGADIAECECGKSSRTIGAASRCGEAPFRYSWRALGGAPLSALSVTDNVPAVLTISDTPSKSTTYSYELTVVDGMNRSTKDTMSYVLHPCPVVDAGVNRELCGPAPVVRLNATVVLDDTSGVTYEWTPSVFLSDPRSPNPSMALPDSNLSIVYRVEARSRFGCVGQDTVVVQTAKTLSVAATLTKSKPSCVCRGESIQLDAQPAGGVPPFTFSWTGATTTSPSLAQTSASPLANSTYTITVTDAWGCTATDTVSVCVEPVPNPLPAPDTTICRGDATPARGLPATCGKPPFRYSWSPSAGVSDVSVFNPVFSPAVTTTYTLSVTDDNGSGATNSASMTITVNELPDVSLGADTSFCAGGSVVTDAVVTGGGSSYTYEWFMNGNKLPETERLIIINGVDSSSKVVCRVTDSNGCSSVGERSVTIFPGPVLKLTSELFVCPCDSLQIGGDATGGTPGYTYRWRGADGNAPLEMDDSTAAKPVVRLTQSRSYTVTVTDAKGCVASFSQSITMGEQPHSVPLFVPDVTANPRNKNVAIPVIVRSYPSTSVCPPRSLEMTISYDAWVYDPTPKISSGTIIRNVLNGRNRDVRVRIQPVPVYKDSAVVTVLTGAALLGEPGTTEVVVKDVTWECSSFLSDSTTGSLTLDSLCETSGTSKRLLRFAAVAEIVSIVPNPSNDVCRLTVRRNSAETVRIIVANMDGVEVYSEEWKGAADGVQAAGGLEERKTVNLRLDSLPQGVYRCMVQSPYAVDSAPMIIIR